MKTLIRQLWLDDRGVIVSTELVLVMSILVFGVLAGLVAVRNATIAALTTLGNTLTNIAPSMTFSGFAIGAPYGGRTIAQVQGYQLDKSTVNILTANQTFPLQLGTLAVIPPSP